MVIRRVVGVLVAALMVSSGLLAQERKLDDVQKKELDSDRKLIDDLIKKGETGPNDLSLAWAREDYLKESNNTQFVPFIVTIDPSKATGGTVYFYWRVTPVADPAAKDKKKVANVWEDISSAIPVSGTGPFPIMRAFAAPAGQYDAYIVVKEPTPKDKKQPFKTSVLKQTVTVPDYWTTELTTSSVMVSGIKATRVTQQYSGAEAIEHPYALGSQEIVPALDTKFNKASELGVYMFIYNPAAEAGGKPNVLLEYNFYTKGADGEKFFNKTSPQELSSKTLPANFDLAAGHQLPGFLSVPLASFPEGQYRLEVKVTDKVSNKSVTREVNFTVAGA